MADSNTETTTPQSDGTTADHGSEFSRGTGPEDSSIWDKHFGKESKDPKAGKDSSTPSRRDSRSSSESTSKERAGGKGDSKEARGSKESAESKQSKSSASPTESKSERSPKEPTKSEKKPDGSEATGQKTADKGKDAKADESEKDSEPADPEAPLKKARDLYKQAQKTEDRRESRKLYKRAMVEAFGELPEEFDDRRYAAVRTERAAAKAALDEQAKKNEGRINEAAQKLKPAIYVMRQLEGAGIADKLTVPMVERAVHVMKALKSLEDGDFTQLAEVVSRAAGVDHDEAMKRFVKGVKISPEGRAARQAAEQSQRENQALKERLQQLESKLTERDTQQTEAQKKQEREQQQQGARTRYLEDIQETLGDHPVLQLPRGAERVMAYQIRHADPKLKSARYTHRQVADRIVRSERERLKSTRHLLDTEGEDVTPQTQTRRSSGSVSRTEQVDAGVANPDPMARFDYFFDKHAGERRAAGRRR